MRFKRPANLSYVIASGARAGTGLLAHGLWSTGRLGRPEEYFNQADLGLYAKRWNLPPPSSEENPAAYVEAYQKASTTPNGVSGLKVMAGSLTTIAEMIGCDAQASPTAVLLDLGVSLVVVCTRNDKVAAAVSQWRAQQTGEFKRFGNSAAVSSESIGYPSDESVAHLLEYGKYSDAVWSSLDCDRIGVIRLVYEEFVEDLPGTIHQISEALQVRPPRIPQGSDLPIQVKDEAMDSFIADYNQRHPPP